MIENRIIKAVNLITFLKGSSDPGRRMPGCCNYVHAGGGCLIWGDCLVVIKKRCSIFEEVVLPTAADIGQEQLIYDQYENRVGIDSVAKKLVRGEIRSCPDCGAELAKGLRFCDTCRRKRRQKTQRENMKRYRLKKTGCCSTVET